MGEGEAPAEPRLISGKPYAQFACLTRLTYSGIAELAAGPSPYKYELRERGQYVYNGVTDLCVGSAIAAPLRA